MPNGMTNANDQYIPQYLIFEIFLARYVFPIPYIFKSSKMINLKKHLKNEKELKGIKAMSFQELGHISIMKLLSQIAEHIFIFYFDIISFYKQSRKLSNQLMSVKI